MSEAILTAEPTAAARSALLWIAAAVLGLAFFFVEHDLRKSQLADYANSEDEMSATVAAGSFTRQAGFLAIGGLGVGLLSLGGPQIEVRSPLAIAILALLAWVVASVAWSPDIMMTGKRILALVLCFLGALGVSRSLRGDDLCTLALVLIGGFLLLGVGAEMALRTFRPWESGYRFAGTLHPNGEGVICAVFCLAALSKAIGARSHSVAYLGLLAVGVALLLLTKSRAATAALAVAAPALLAVRISFRTTVLTVIVAATLLSSGALVAALAGYDVLQDAKETILFGRTDGAETFSGRVPLWEDLLTYAGQRPLLGYGYDSFWTPDRITDVTRQAGWAIDSAHSSYVDALLSLGGVGFVLLMAIALMAIVRSASVWSAEGAVGACFLCGLLVMGMVNGTMESSFIRLETVPFLAACGVAQMAFFPVREEARACQISM